MPSSDEAALSALVAGLAPQVVEAIVVGLREGQITLDSSAVGVAALRGVSPDAAMQTTLVFQSLDKAIEPTSVALALSTANKLRARERLSRPEIEIVWSGPRAPGTIMRPTGAVVEEMLRDTRESGEVLVVGYSLTAPDGSLMREIVELLAEASRRGALITFVLHRDGEDKNKANLLDAWSVFARKPLVYTWRPGQEYPYPKLHAKTLVVDRLDLLVTSANLTLHGLEANLELGLRVRGPQAGVVAERFDQLIADGVLGIWRD